MSARKHSLIFLTVIIDHFSFSQCFVMSNCLSSYCVDETWPDFDTTQPLQIYGSAISIDKRNVNRVIILHRSNSMEKPSKSKDSSRNSSHGHIFIEDDVIMILDSMTGKVIGTWGGNKFVRPHGLEVTDQGAIFITDVRMHQVFKFIPTTDGNGLWQNTPDLILGETFVSGNDRHHFCSPADVAIMPSTGDIFVADGYCNSRIVKFSKDGSYLGEFGAGSPEPHLSPAVPFNVSHAVSIAVPYKDPDTEDESSSNENEATLPTLIFVADRNNGRIQCFTENGTFLYQIAHENFGPEKEMILSLALTSPSNLHPYGTLFVINGNLPLGEPSVFEVHVTHLEFNIISSFPISKFDQSKHADVSKNVAGEQRIEIPHDITVTPDGNMVYVIEAYKTLQLKRFRKRNMMSSKACLHHPSSNLFRQFDMMIVVSAFLVTLLGGSVIG